VAAALVLAGCARFTVDVTDWSDFAFASAGLAVRAVEATVDGAVARAGVLYGATEVAYVPAGVDFCEAGRSSFLSGAGKALALPFVATVFFCAGFDFAAIGVRELFAAVADLTELPYAATASPQPSNFFVIPTYVSLSMLNDMAYHHPQTGLSRRSDFQRR
jgi:hypothetical protein